MSWLLYAQMSRLCEREAALRKKFSDKLRALLEEEVGLDECDGIEDVA